MTIKSATAIIMFITACITIRPISSLGQSHPKSVQITRGADGQKIVYGKATHYSRSLDGTKTAIGTRYRNSKLTAASNFFKLRTWVRVTRLSNGKSVTVYINDRMHRSMASKGRIIDLSVAAAEKLHFMGPAGITRVKVEEIPENVAVSVNDND
ncbi:septal ring lytic transglycosylase RlpA family protein [Arachidicoccus terrestris]|uniref:septal ring lytic transglycosylase RlpA family protein n=1 Tax=Arachidicoccus terrestris TaxID=2875539 RepID=UPI001CC6323B|nr:septal ring lytic transglycosylase RlpA family protein [Arachidicoccus terrestris]UAY55189.1 septal ring lytic transglycosylase RlpA family protein [Arachidicoccus terrestris]